MHLDHLMTVVDTAAYRRFGEVLQLSKIIGTCCCDYHGFFVHKATANVSGVDFDFLLSGTVLFPIECACAVELFFADVAGTLVSVMCAVVVDGSVSDFPSFQLFGMELLLLLLVFDLAFFLEKMELEEKRKNTSVLASSSVGYDNPLSVSENRVRR